MADDRARVNVSKTSHVQMIDYLNRVNVSLIRQLVDKTAKPPSYQAKDDLSDQDGYIDSQPNEASGTFIRITMKQLTNQTQPVLFYSQYRKSFNRTLEKIYKDQIVQTYDRTEIRRYLTGKRRDQLISEYHRSALKTALQCLTGAAGANNIPADFCEAQLKKQRSMNWAVLPDKPSPIDGTVRPFAVIITIRGGTTLVFCISICSPKSSSFQVH